jgi:hypothetical protein
MTKSGTPALAVRENATTPERVQSLQRPSLRGIQDGRTSGIKRLPCGVCGTVHTEAPGIPGGMGKLLRTSFQRTILPV